MPVYAGMMDPLFGCQVYHCPFEIRTQKAVWGNNYCTLLLCGLISLDYEFAFCTEPSFIVRQILVLIQIPSVACWMYHNKAKLTLSQGVIILIFPWETNVTMPVILIFKIFHHYSMILFSKIQDLLWDLSFRCLLALRCLTAHFLWLIYLDLLRDLFRGFGLRWVEFIRGHQFLHWFV